MCRNIFEGKKYVEEYRVQDVESELGMSRDKLIQLALLLGSDYTEGVAGIGIVNAVEIVNAFPTEELLVNFRCLCLPGCMLHWAVLICTCKVVPCKQWLASTVCCCSANLPSEPCCVKKEGDSTWLMKFGCCPCECSWKIVCCRAQSISKFTEKYSLKCLFWSTVLFPERCI